ncbi:hypothetical protein V496_01253 [Pseudogymnoascus sp. VKM F-4515 (FW-2607)]|nr:hypothetical protein V496_01253 [Pseudogymnoascus sp. VKM F-4515 (FW-2607)]
MTLSSAAHSFSNFHGYRNEVPTEIAAHIIQYVIAGAQQLPFGGGTTVRRAHHPVASVSRILRSIYLSHPYPTIAKNRGTARANIGGALEFSDLKTLAAFFQEGPGRYVANIHKVRFLSICYVDDDTVRDRWRQTIGYAYEAFELLYTSWSLMQISELQLCLLGFNAISSVDDPGIWSLLKIRGLAHLTILGPHRCIVPEVRKWLKARTHRRKLLPWVALGVENPGPSNWIDCLKYQDVLPHWQQQYEWLDARYKYLHDRETVAARCAKQRLAYDKRRRRWPMLSKRRRSCL